MENTKYLSVTEFSNLYEIDPGRVRRLIGEGRIPAIKIGNQWAIESNIKPPKDKRITSGKYIGYRKSKKQ